MKRSTQYIIMGAVAFVVLLGALLIVSNQGGQDGTATQIASAPTEEQVNNVTPTPVPGFRNGEEQPPPADGGTGGEQPPADSGTGDTGTGGEVPPPPGDTGTGGEVPPPPGDTGTGGEQPPADGGGEQQVPPPPGDTGTGEQPPVDPGTLDDDSDGVLNASDECPDRGDILGFGVFSNGCPAGDSDNDGNGDLTDQCVNEGDLGFGVDDNGCPIRDTDNDGQGDNVDVCPSEGDLGFGLLSDGCPVRDGDSDGVGDNVDACPDQGDAGFGLENGCPLPAPTEEATADPQLAGPLSPEVTAEVTQEAGQSSISFSFNATAEGLVLSGTASASSTAPGDVTITWDFGDGNSATGTEVSHTYAANGEYTVTVTVSDSTGNSSSDSRTIQVSGTVTQFSDCGITSAEIVGDPNTLPVTVRFIASGSNITAFNWSFSNGATASGTNAEVSFDAASDYTYTLTCVVADDMIGAGNVLGNDYVFTDVVSITGGQTISARIIAGFVIEQGALEVGQTVNLTNTSRIEGEGTDGATLSYSWSVSGPESFSGTDTNFTFTPAQTGVYNITLIVTTVINGRTISAPATGFVQIVENVPAPNIRLTLDPSSGKFPLDVTATLSNTGGPISSYSWDFGGGTGGDASAAGPHALNFAAAGKYTVSVSVSGPGGTANASAEVVVLEDLIPLKANFSAVGSEPVNGVVNYCFTDSSEGDEITNFEWSLVNTITNEAISLPAFSGRGGQLCVDLTEGVYRVSLSVSNPGGKQSSASALFEIAEGIRSPQVEITGGETNVNVGQTVTYTATYTGAVRQFVWTITGDSAEEVTTAEPSLTRTFAAEGNFVIRVRAVGPGGIAESAAVNVEVAYPAISCPISGTTGNANYNVSQTYTYSVNISNQQAAGRTLEYAWTINGSPAGNGTSVTLPAITQPGTTTVGLQVLIGGQVVCERSASVNFSIRTVTCDIDGDNTPRLNQSVTYKSKSVSNLDGRTITSTAWELSGVTAQGSNGAYTFDTPGTGSLTMTLTLSDGSVCSKTTTITVSESAYECRMDRGEQNKTVSLYSSSTYRAVIDGVARGATVRYDWTTSWSGGTGDNGSGSSSSSGSNRELAVVFDKPGASYSVKADIYVNGTFVCSVTRGGVGVGTSDPFTCDFSGDLTAFLNQSKTYSATINGRGSRSISTYSWSLSGQGVSETGSGASFSPIFRTAGSYDISFSATLSDGSTCAIRTKTVVVSQTEATCRLNIPNNVPNDRNASLSVSISPSNVVTGLNWTFNGKTYSGSSISIPATDLLAAGLGGLVTFTGTSSDGRTICALEAQLTIVERPLECRISLPQSITIGEAFNGSVNITNLNGRTVTYQWTVNGQPVSDSSSFSNTYEGEEGDVVVVLTATPSQGVGCSVSTTVKAAERARISAEADRYVVPLNSTVNFSAITVGIDRTTLTWIYPDGSRERAENGRFRFTELPQGDFFEVVVEGRNPILGTLRASVQISVVTEARLNVSFNANPWQTTVGNEICFTDTTTSSNPNTSQWTWSWDFAGLGSSNAQNPCFTFPDVGDYSVRLVVNDGLLENDARNIVQVFSVINSNARFDIRYQGRGEVCFTPQAEGVTITGWDFGDGNGSDTAGEVCHTYVEDGNYNVTMRFRQGQAQSVVTRSVTLQGGGSTAAPVINANAICTADGVATFTLTNVGGDMTSAGSVAARVGDETISLGDFLLVTGSLSRTFSVENAFGQTVTFITSGGGIAPITLSTNCADQRYELASEAVCVNGVATFTVTHTGEGTMKNAATVFAVITGPDVEGENRQEIGSFTLGPDNRQASFSVNQSYGNNVVFQVQGGDERFSTARLTENVKCDPEPYTLSAEGVCVDGVATFTITKQGSGPIRQPISYVIYSVSGDNRRSIGEGQITNGNLGPIVAPQAFNSTVSVEFSGGDETFDANTLNRSVRCEPQPYTVSGSAQCVDGVVSYTFTNNGPGRMLSNAELTITVEGRAGQRTESYSFAVQPGAPISDQLYKGPYFGDTVTFTYSGGDDFADVTATNSSVRCDEQPYTLSAEAVCRDGNLTVKVTNDGAGPVISPITVNVADGEGNPISMDGSNIDSLNSGQSANFSATEEQWDKNIVVTLSGGDEWSNVLQVSANATCDQQPYELAPELVCEEGVISFNVTKSGAGSVKNPVGYIVTATDNNSAVQTILEEGTLDFSGGNTFSRSFSDQFNQAVSVTFSGGDKVFDVSGLTRSTNCDAERYGLSASAVCVSGVVTYTLSNGGAGDMLSDAVVTATITDRDGNPTVLEPEDFRLDANESDTITLSDLWGSTVVFEVTGGDAVYESFSAVANADVTCEEQPYTLSAEAVCEAGDLLVTITNNGTGPMIEDGQLVVTDGEGNPITMSGSSFGLPSGEAAQFSANNQWNKSIRVSLDGGDEWSNISDVSAGADCAKQPYTVTLDGVCEAGVATFTITNNGEGPTVEPLTFSYSQSFVSNGIDTISSGIAQSMPESFGLAKGEQKTFTINGAWNTTLTGFLGGGDGEGITTFTILTDTLDCAPQPYTLTPQAVCEEGVAIYTLTNNGPGTMVGVAGLSATVSGPFGTRTVDLGRFLLDANQQYSKKVDNAWASDVTFTVTGGDEVIESFGAVANAGTKCAPQPYTLNVTGVCVGGEASFTVTNVGPGPMINSSVLVVETIGEVIDTGSEQDGEERFNFKLGSNESQTFITSSRWNEVVAAYVEDEEEQATVRILSEEVECDPQPYTLSVVGSCLENTVMFSVSNEGPGNMVIPQSYRLLSNGVDTTPRPNTFQLNAGQRFDLPMQYEVFDTTIVFESEGLAFGEGGLLREAVSLLNQSIYCTPRPEVTPTPTTPAPSETPVTPTSTPEATAPADLICGEDMAVSASEFPMVNMDSRLCGPDRERAIPNWRPVVTGPAICVDWLAYHTNITGDWEIFRLGEFPEGLGYNMEADVNMSKGRGSRISDLGPARSPDAKHIAFYSNRDGNWEIYVAPVDGTLEDQQRVTYNDNAMDMDPVWSPDGTKLAYESNVDGNWEIRLVDLLTGEKYRLTDNPANDINPYWGLDGTKLLFQSDREGSWQIYELDVTDFNAPSIRRITTPIDGVDYQDAQFSNDNQRIAMRAESVDASGSLQSVIFILDLTTGELTQVSQDGADSRNFSWAPDDSLIAYQSDLVSDTYDIYVYEVETAETRLLTNNDGESLGNVDTSPTWICESTTVVFTSDAIDGQNEIYSLPALPIDGPAVDVVNEANRLTSTDANDRDPQNAPSEENASRNGQVPPKYAPSN